MKNVIVFILTLVFMLSLAGCNAYWLDDTTIPSANNPAIEYPTIPSTNDPAEDPTIPSTNDSTENAFFIGKVIEVYGNGYLLKVINTGNYHFRSGEKVAVDIDDEKWFEFSVSDYLYVEFDKERPMSKPALIESKHVYDVKQTDENGNIIE